MKVCNKCKIEKPITEFYKRKPKKDGRKDSIDGYRSWCKQCDSEYAKINKDKLREYYNTPARKEIESNRKKKYYLENKDLIKSRLKRYRENNKDKVNAKTMRRLAAKLNAIPKWFNADNVYKLYEKCKEISISTGINHHVDHIVPLQSEYVCGLHCEENLQIITAEENYSKNNRFWPEMW